MIRFGIGVQTSVTIGLIFHFSAFKSMSLNQAVRKRIGRGVCIVALIATGSAHGQTNTFVMPLIGEPLPTSKFEIINQIPKSRLSSAPKTLPICRYSSKPREASCAGLQELLDMSVFKGTNISDLFHGQTNVLLLRETVRLATPKNLDYFSIDPDRGSVSVYNNIGTGVNLRTETPEYDTIPNFESIQKQVMSFARMFGVSTNEMERKEDGSILLRRTDGTTVARGGAVKFISRRSVGVSRSVAGYSFLGNDEKMELVLGVKGRLQQFDLRWRPMEAVRTNRVFDVNEILEQIKQGRVLGDVMNKYPNDGIAKITLKDIRILYYVPTSENHGPVSPSADIFPIASLHAVFSSKKGEAEEGGLFVRLTESP